MNTAERHHLDRVASLGCIVCLNLGHEDTPACCHHIRYHVGAGRRASHFETIPLCPRHHDGHGLGVSFHAGKRTWEAKFGTELELLEQVRQLLNPRVQLDDLGSRGEEPLFVKPS